MSQLSRHPAYLMIEDRLDAIGQRFRVQRIVRGLMLFVGAAVVATLAAALAAHALGTRSAGTSPWLPVIPWLWGILLLAAFLAWFVRPMVLRPKPLEVARLVETRVPGLFNGLTNSLQLARAEDLQASPWLPAIFSEVAGNAGGKPLEGAVKFSDLRPLALRLALVLLPLLICCAFPAAREMLGHGWAQMFSPAGTFVPKAGSRVKSLKVEPGDVTLVVGQPLEIFVTATSNEAKFEPTAKLIFDGDREGADLTPVPVVQEAAGATPGAAEATALKYSHRVKHLDATLRYRVEVADAQSPWYEAKAVPQVRLQSVELEVTPPPYMKKEPSRQVIAADDLAKTPLTVPQGSAVVLRATVDVASRAAMLLLGDQEPASMSASQGGRRFEGQFTVVDETTASVLLTTSTGQPVSQLPEGGLAIHCAKDAPPTIEMKWPTADAAVTPQAPIQVGAELRDDYGLGQARVWMASGPDEPLAPVATVNFPPGVTAAPLSQLLTVPAEARAHGKSVRVQVSLRDNRDLRGLVKDAREAGPQTTLSAVYEIKFRDPRAIAAEQKDVADQLRVALLAMLKQQNDLHGQALAAQPESGPTAAPTTRPAGKPAAEKAAGNLNALKAAMQALAAGQGELRGTMRRTAETFKFDEPTKVIQKTLLVMAAGPAREAADLPSAVANEPVARERARLGSDLQARQRRIITTLESLLAFLNLAPDPTALTSKTANDPIPDRAEKFQKLNEALKEFMKEEQRILDQTAALAKKPVDNFTDKDKQLLEDLKQAQDKMDAFMQEKIADFSKNAEQDMSNAALIKDMLAVYSEVTMAKDALKQQSMEIAVAAEEMGLENAKELSSNIEKWLANAPDRQKWTQEDPTGKNDTPMPELPKEMEDMVGKLMEQQEDLDEEMEDANANWTDSMDKGVGWDAADGPIADMSAKGVTGNTLPNNNEMGGRSGEGRSGKSQGEFVGDNAQGKGGRNTPTRVDPTPFAQGQIKDESKDPVGGATGGGKLSGQGAAGLEGPVPPKIKQEMQRLADKQAQIRNSAERLQLQYHLGRYDNFNLAGSIALMRRTESDLRANRYQNAMRNKDVIVDDLAASKMLLGGRVHVQHDTTPTATTKLNEEINDAMKGDMPAAWSEALKEYYKKLGSE